MGLHYADGTTNYAGYPLWTVTGDSNANAEKTISKVAETGRRHYVVAVEAVISGAVAGSDITVELKDGDTTVKWKTVIGSGAARGARAGFALPNPIAMSAGNAANLVASAGGAACVVTLNLAGYTV